jgi:hypothetical protein
MPSLFEEYYVKRHWVLRTIWYNDVIAELGGLKFQHSGGNTAGSRQKGGHP